MALTITDKAISSDQTGAIARHVANGLWQVVDHPEVTHSAVLSRNEAITAMTLAEALAADPPRDSRLWIAIEGWREELGLTTS